MSDILNQKIEFIIDNFVREQNIPTIEVAITNEKNDFIKYKSGLHVNKNEYYQPDGIFLAASISKTVTSLAIYNLICNNELSLHDRILEIIPSLAGCSNIDYNCRVIDLLTHSGGIVEIAYRWSDKDYNDISCLESFKNRIYKFTVDCNMISKFKYGNIGYDILGAVIESLKGRSFSSYINESIFKKLSIDHTYYNIKDIPQVKLLNPYIKTKMELLPVCGYPHAIRHNPSAVMYTNVSDLTKLARLHLNKGTLNNVELLQPECYDLIWEKLQNTGFSPNKHYGIGWFIGKFRGIEVVGHGGREYGFNSITVICPALKIGIAILTNVHTADSLKLSVKLLNVLLNHANKNLTILFT